MTTGYTTAGAGLRWMGFALVVAGIGAVAIAAFARLTHKSLSPEHWYEITNPIQDLGPVRAGEIAEVVFEIHNNSEADQQIVGMTEFCGRNCCFQAKGPSRMWVPGKSIRSYSVLVKVYDPGPFRADMEIYLQQDGIVAVQLAVVGFATETRSR